MQPTDTTSKLTNSLNAADCIITAHRMNRNEVQWGASAYAAPANPNILLSTEIQIETEGF
jgi:hypothetical protein